MNFNQSLFPTLNNFRIAFLAALSPLRSQIQSRGTFKSFCKIEKE